MLEIQTSKINNTVTFSVDRNSMKEAMDAFDQIQKKAKGIKDPTLNMKKFSQGLKSAERELDKLNKKASKPRDNSQREAERAAKAKARAEAQAAKEAARSVARRERAELKLLDTASSFRSMQHLTNVELTQAALAASRITKAYSQGTISLARQNSEIKRLQQSYRRINAERRAAAKANALGGGGKATGAISGSLMGLGTGALAGAGIGAAAYGAYSWGKEAVTAQEERSEIVQRARLGNVDYNALQAQSQYATANGIDSGMGIQGQRKLLDNYKDIQDRIGQTLNEAKYDKKSGQWKGGDQGILSAVNTAGFTLKDLQSYQKNPMGFVSAYTNTLEKQGKSPEQILASLEQLGDDLGLYHKAFMNGGKALTDQVDVLKRNGQWLNQEQQDQLVAYRKFNQDLSILSDSQKLAFFEGFMSEIDPETMREFKEAMQEALPFFNGLGKAAGDVVDGLMKMTNWITGKLNLLNGDNTSKEAVSQHYGTTSAPGQPGSNPVANAYGASQPKADGTHQPNVFDTFHDWWNGTSDAKDVSSYAQSTNGDYSPVSMLKQSAAAPVKPANAPIMQPVVLQNQLPEGLIHLTISPDPTFGNMLNATVDQRINDNNQRMVLAVSSGQGTGG
ncbi:TPA: hypothetical protein ACPY3K_003805 [Enterobacter hormaechei subsp. xiangfangensis]|mgnify:CR=1 FL=1|uniref:hypothetical protein n=1 Tax=Enterobacter hormaechei TaxID=158836 RepID=UPI0005F27445|nr:hypothetical protein [Enterobacter hormaechei]HDT4163235.1 hypothetical protein [Enterobacter hormaechei subsp. steigerwaltii]KJL66352.1 hypothetical protein SS38_21905 [Enterobacter hormaechei subsp. xiangfangensis]MBG0715533.1 hypothetical protein [Enterobacter hormaechei]MBT1902326.1 hypothetical protein [Enterobacter hormaechei subsp. xiangfangensis]MDV5280719.1 hypothetical protein [Enterobacter hormaechei]